MDDYDHAMKVFDQIAHEVDHLTNAELLEIGHSAVTIIAARTKHGIDVDGRPFIPYSPEYAKLRKEKGLETRVDLARKGHMIGALVPKVTGPGEVSVMFTDSTEATIAAAHNEGARKSGVSVRGHSRSTFVDKHGRRVSREEVRKDARRKNKRVTQRTEQVGGHGRNMVLPKREFFDVRLPRELEILEGIIGHALTTRVEKIK